MGKKSKKDDFIVDSSDEEEDSDGQPKPKKAKTLKKRSKPNTKTQISDDDDSAAASSGDEAGAAEKARAGSDRAFDKDDEGNDFIKLGQEKRLTVSNFKGHVLLNIREYYFKDGKALPGKKGITLKPEQLQVILDHAEEIQAAAKALEKKK